MSSAPTSTERYEHPCKQTVWPTIDAAADLDYMLRYRPDGIAREDQLVLASICAAYIQLRQHPTSFTDQEKLEKKGK